MLPISERTLFYWKVPRLSPFVLLIKAAMKMKMSMDHWWNEAEKRKPNYWEKHLSQCHFVHHWSHMDYPGIELGPPRWKASDWRPEPCRQGHSRRLYLKIQFLLCTKHVRSRLQNQPRNTVEVNNCFYAETHTEYRNTRCVTAEFFHI